LEYITQFFKENPIINFISQLELSFFGKMLKSIKIALVVAALWLLITTNLHWYKPSNPSNTIPIIKNNSNIGVYNPKFQGESDCQLCFSIGLMILW
jgi:hypothetical protein